LTTQECVLTVDYTQIYSKRISCVAHIPGYNERRALVIYSSWSLVLS
jgi:hypothetical protein